MLDKRCFALLDLIIKRCAGSGYKIFSVTELINGMPKRFNLDGEGLFERLEALSARDYISVKYQDEDEVCLRPLIKGSVALESKTDREKEQVKSERKYFIFALLGGLIGGIISGLTALAVCVLGG